MADIKVTVDNITVTVPEGSTLLDAAHKAVLIVIGQDQLKSFTSVVFNLLGIGKCYHTVCAWVYAGSDKSSCSNYLTYAHSAGTDFIDVSQIA